MPAISTYNQLPAAIQARVDEILREGRFANYEDLTRQVNELLAEQGFEVQFARSTLHRRGKELQAIINKVRESHEAAQYVMEAFPEDEERVSEATIRLVQERMFSLLMDLPVDGELNAKDLSAIARAAADITRANIGERKYRAEIQEKLKDRLDGLEKAKGLDYDTLQRVRQEIYGLF